MCRPSNFQRSLRTTIIYGAGDEMQEVNPMPQQQEQTETLEEAVLAVIHREGLLLERPRRPHETFMEVALAAILNEQHALEQEIAEIAAWMMKHEEEQERAQEAEALRLQKEQDYENEKASRTRLGLSKVDED
jgi:hypothetical protein